MARLKPSSHGRPWTKKEENLLVWRWAEFSIASTAKLLGRTKRAVYAKGLELKLSRTKEAESLIAFSKRVGYSRNAILRAIQKLNLPVRRRPRSLRSKEADFGRFFHITPEQGEQIIAFLLTQKTTPSCHPTRKHWAKGLCANCYKNLMARRKRAESRQALLAGGIGGSSGVGAVDGVRNQEGTPPGSGGVPDSRCWDGANHGDTLAVSGA